MLNLKKLLEKPEAFRRLTGLSPVKFQELAVKVEPRFIQARIKRLSQRSRKRSIGAGSKFKLSVPEALFTLVLYYRTYLPHLFIGSLMDIDESNVSRYIKRIEPLLAGIFRIPEKRIKISREDVLGLIIDATEQETENRKGSGWSGKKKRHTVKTQIIVNSKGKIKSVSKSVRGNIHDKKLYDQTRTFSNVKVKLKADLGYVGTSCQTPIKKQPLRGLTKKQKTDNRLFNQQRCPVERTFAHLKNFKILANRFRNNLNNYSLIFKNIAGLYNFQLA